MDWRSHRGHLPFIDNFLVMSKFDLGHLRCVLWDIADMRCVRLWITENNKGRLD